ncbi:insulinase family protein, partial [Pseudomonas sp. FSL R10-0071]|nr:insulinase family protein [Pseudomonas sp. FSL R10-0071]
MNHLARCAAGLLLSTVLLPLSAFAADAQPTHEFRLDNGLKVIVREDHRAPVVVSQVW